MSINEIIIYIMAICAAAGAVDRIFGCKLGLGKQFEEGLLAIGTLSLSMIGILVLAPVIADVLEPVIVPLFRLLGADPAVFAGSILANDMGAAPLAAEMAFTKEAGDFGGLIVGAMLGVTVVFTIPATLGIISKEDHPYAAKGILSGVITIPFGCIAGGLTAGYPIRMILQNLFPIILIAVLIALGLWKVPNLMLRGFHIFGKGITALISFGLGAGILEALTGFAVIKGITPIRDGFAVVADISIVLAGAFPFVHILTKIFRRPLMWLGSSLRMNEVAAAGMIASLANSIPMFGMIKNMDERGKVINMAFAVSAAFVFGDHLGFTAGFSPDMILPMIIGKLTGGITAVLAACLITRERAV